MFKSLFACLIVMLVLITSNISFAGVSTDTIKSGDEYYVSDRATWGNCVKYARLFKPSLPYGLDTAASKKKVINSSNPKKGRIAIMAVGSFYHVGRVEKEDNEGKNLSITIVEANYRSNQLTRRKATCTKSIGRCEADLKIIGYFK